MYVLYVWTLPGVKTNHELTVRIDTGIQTNVLVKDGAVKVAISGTSGTKVLSDIVIFQTLECYT
jgi:hypothetical protein